MISKYCKAVSFFFFKLCSLALWSTSFICAEKKINNDSNKFYSFACHLTSPVVTFHDYFFFVLEYLECPLSSSAKFSLEIIKISLSNSPRGQGCNIVVEFHFDLGWSVFLAFSTFHYGNSLPQLFSFTIHGVSSFCSPSISIAFVFQSPFWTEISLTIMAFFH